MAYIPDKLILIVSTNQSNMETIDVEIKFALLQGRQLAGLDPHLVELAIFYHEKENYFHTHLIHRFIGGFEDEYDYYGFFLNDIYDCLLNHGVKISSNQPIILLK